MRGVGQNEKRGWEERVKRRIRSRLDALERWLVSSESRRPAGVRKNLLSYARATLSKSRRKLAGLVRSRKKITFERLSYGLVILRWLAVVQVWLSLWLRPSEQVFTWAVALTLYAAMVTMFAAPIHRHLASGRWPGPVALDAFWLLWIVIATGGVASPVSWVLCVPAISAGMYARSYRRRTTLSLALLLVTGYVFAGLGKGVGRSADSLALLGTTAAVIIGASAVGALVAVLGRSHGKVYELRDRVGPKAKCAEPVDTVVEVVSEGVANLQRDSLLLAKLITPECRKKVRAAVGLSREEWPAQSVLPARDLTDDEKRLALARLTPVQLEVVEMRADGVAIPEIASYRGTSRDAVEDALRRVKDSIGIRDQTELALFAVITGLRTP